MLSRIVPMATAVFLIESAGDDAANGPYWPTGRVRFGAPIYENDMKCLLSREPHRNSATGETKHGWIIGKGGKPLYGAVTDSLKPPAVGWMKFGGSFPVPNVASADAVSVSIVAAERFKEQGKELFAEKAFAEAEAKWTRAIALPDIDDLDLVVALYSNRAEGRLRQYKWTGALADAEEVLKRRPAHEKALLRGAVALRELKEYPRALDLVQQCLDAHPKHVDAKHLSLEIAKLLDAENEGLTNNALKAAKVQDDFFKQEDGELGALPKAFAAKDTNSKMGFKAFTGYGEGRTTDEPVAVPVAALPYHSLGLPADRVEAFDKEIQAARDKKDEKRQREKEAQQKYSQIKQDYKERATENIKMGKVEPPERMVPSSVQQKKLEVTDDVSAVEAKILAQALTGPSVEKETLSEFDAAAIDALFAGMSTRPSPEAKGAAASAGGRKAKFKKARELVTSAK